MTSRIESSLDKLTDIMTTAFNASGSRKRTPDDLSCEAGPLGVMQVARLSHKGDSDKKFEESGSEDDSVSIPDSHIIDTDIAELLSTDDEDKKAFDPKEDQGEEFLAHIEAELCITEEKGDTINTKLASVVNSLGANKLSDEKLKDRLKKQLIPENCTNINVAKCNPEIWGNLPYAKKLQDISIRKI